MDTASSLGDWIRRQCEAHDLPSQITHQPPPPATGIPQDKHNHSNLRSVSNLSKPARDSVLVFKIGLAKACLQITFFSRNDSFVHERCHDQQGSKYNDAPIKDCPSKPQHQFSTVHRIAREFVRTASQQIGRGSFYFHSLGDPAEMQDHEPDQQDCCEHNWYQAKQVPNCRATIYPSIARGEK